MSWSYFGERSLDVDYMKIIDDEEWDPFFSLVDLEYNTLVDYSHNMPPAKMVICSIPHKAHINDR
jgi:hypothetical protein